MRKTILACVALTVALVPAFSASAWADSQDIGQQASSQQGASSTATSTQTNPSNQAINVSILSPGAGGGAVNQSNSSSANSSAGNTNGTSQTAGQTGGGGGGGVQAIGQQADNHQEAGSQATSTQSNPSNQAITVSILSPHAGGGSVTQSNSSDATSAAGNTNGTSQTAQQSAGGMPLVTCEVCHPQGASVQGIGQLAQNGQQAGSAATSDQHGASNVAAPVDVLAVMPHTDHALTAVSPGGSVNQSNSSSANSSAGNTNGTSQTAQQYGGWGAVQAIGQAAGNAQQAMSAATSTQWCPANVAFGNLASLMQSNASAALSAAGNTNGTSQTATQA
jgi:hypothetical protein